MAVDIYSPSSLDGLDSEEVKLINLINQYRAQNGLPPIPKSKALTTVSNRHVQDLAGNLGSVTHSWSDAPYDPKNPTTWSNMWGAPQRFKTGYPGNGYENAFGGSGGFVATAEAALKGWKESSLHNAVILNQGIWAGKQWKALGVGIYKGYAVMWVGEESDPTGEPSISSTPTPTPIPTLTPTNPPVVPSSPPAPPPPPPVSIPTPTPTPAPQPPIPRPTLTPEIVSTPTSPPTPQPPIPQPTPTPGLITTPTPNPSISVSIKTPTINAIGNGSPTQTPKNTVSGGNYYLSDNADISIPTAAMGLPILALSGRDNLTGTSGPDTINGMQGADTINGADGSDSLSGGKESDSLVGGAGNDFLSGNNDNDTLVGGDGNDTLRGGKENDVLLGGDGNDLLVGDRGTDILTSGVGNDTFVLGGGQVAASNLQEADVITDFQAGDRIGLTDGLSFGNLTFEAVSLKLDEGPSVPSTAIKSGNNYLGIVYAVAQSDLTSEVFISTT